MSYFDLFALFGIGLEIWGFIWILKYNRIQKASDLQTWAIRNGYSEKWLWEIQRERHMIIDDDLEVKMITEKNKGGEVWSVPENFYNYCESRRKWSIVLVVIGLTGQMLQILSVYIIPSQT